MADCNIDLDSTQVKPSIVPTNSPPPSPPIADATESDLKVPRKREREVSLEPATPKSDVLDIDAGRQEGKERRTPAKKNRTHLDITEEEEDAVSGSRTPSHSPPLGTSPPTEMKIRQISQGVEDLTWQNGMKKVAAEEDVPVVVSADTDLATDDAVQEAEVVAVVTDEDAKGTADGDTEAQTSVVDDGATDVTEEADVGDEIPAPAPVPSSLPEEEPEVGEKEKGVKRKYGARITSGDLLRTSQFTEPLKRPRDDNDKDDNPRETKRPSPPPEPEIKPAPVPAPTTKLSGFMAFATSSSPFASVKGQNIFSGSNKTLPAAPLLSSSTSPFAGLSSADTQSSSTTLAPPAGLSQSLPKMSGFASYMNSASPFTSSKPSKSPASGSEAVPKFSGFESFMGTSSPFASATRPKSPPLVSRSPKSNKSPTRRAKPVSMSAFSSYATGGTYGFHVPKRARAGSPSGGSSRSSLERSSGLFATGFNGTTDSGGEEEEEDRSLSFGEKLRAGRDQDEETASDEEKGKFSLEEQQIITGEEDEDTLYQVRGKLFSLSSQNQWAERGTGLLKLNVRRYEGTGARIVMRKDAVYTLLLNATLFPGMRCFLAQDPRYLRFSIIEDGATVHYNLRVASAKVAQELLEEINANIPTL